MPTEFSTAEMLPAARKIDGALDEMASVEAFMAEDPFATEIAPMRWSAVTTVAAAIHNTYNGIEDAMKTVCSRVDGSVPEGPTSHQAIIDQLSVAHRKVRPAVLDRELAARLQELKAFRHRVNHNYANDLNEERVLANLDLMRKSLPDFVAAMLKLDAYLSEPGDHDNDDTSGDFKP